MTKIDKNNKTEIIVNTTKIIVINQNSEFFFQFKIQHKPVTPNCQSPPPLSGLNVVPKSIENWLDKGEKKASNGYSQGGMNEEKRKKME